jgi:uncharacterized protein
MAAQRVLLLSDGKPGHFQLAQGIVAAVTRGSAPTIAQQRNPWTVTQLDVARPWWQPTRAWAIATNGQHVAPSRALGLTCGKSVDELVGMGPFQLVVSAGGDTLAANVAAARLYGCPNVFYGSLRRYRASNFALVLTSYAGQVQHAHQVMTLKPSAFDPDTLRRPRSLSSLGSGEQPLIVGLLVGGDSGTVRFGGADWRELFGLLEDLHPAYVQWVVANSRRTPAAVSDRLGELAALTPRIQFVDVRTAGAGTLLDLFNRCDAIAVTLDSSSMVSEAVWSRRPVVALAPVVADLPPLEMAYRAGLAKQSLISTVQIGGLKLAGLLDQFASVTPLADNPLDALAGLLREKMPAVFAASLDQ